MQELLARLSQTYGPSGSEASVAALIQEEIGAYVDEIRTDVMGNVIAVKKGAGKRVMLAAHMDQIGIIVTHIDEQGFLRFSNIGGISPQNLLHKRVVFANGTFGVVGIETQEAADKTAKLGKMFIDIGSDSKAAAESLVSIGDAAVYAASLAAAGGRYIGGALDDRAGCALLIETVKTVAQSPHEIYFVFTVQEEVGLRGARTAAYGIAPDLAFAVDVTMTGDTPKSRPMAVSLGKGPAIKVKDTSMIAHPRVKALMMETAEQAGIPYQLEVLEMGGTDAGAMHLTREGVPAGVLSIPCRYIHSANEMVDAGDMDQALKLLTALLNGPLAL